jgi:hypothetical protein
MTSCFQNNFIVGGMAIRQLAERPPGYPLQASFVLRIILVRTKICGVHTKLSEGGFSLLSLAGRYLSNHLQP